MENKVRLILSDIRRRGDAEVASLLRRFDGVSLSPKKWRIPQERARKALGNLSPEMRSILTEAARRIRDFHKEERRRMTGSWRKISGGVTLGQETRPVDSAGLYVPGGRFAYPSTALMTAIPAKAAGVKRLVMMSPPRHLTNDVLAAAHLAGVDEIYQIGGVAAVGVMAYGTQTIRPVDIIAGPGGAWVTEAKRQVFGVVGIDALAGPSEIVLLVDKFAPPAFAAADMMAQAEHDPLARSTVISPEAETLRRVRENIDKRFLPQCHFVKAKNWADAVDKANAAAPEHLSLMVKNPEAMMKNIRNAGAVFLGPWSPVAAGDYWAGPSHVLPTGRAARFSSGLSVHTFMKRSSVIGISPAVLRKKAEGIARLAEAEGLVQHAASLRARMP